MSVTLSIVIPVYDSERTLNEVFKRLSNTLPLFQKDYEIIFVDDGSRDGSFSKLKELQQKDKRVKAIQLAGNFGQQSALMCGLKFAEGDFIVTMDDDLQHPPEEIGKLLTKIRTGYDVVYGIPKKREHNGFRNFGSGFFNLVFSLLFLKPLNLRIGSFRVLKKHLAKEIIKEKRPFIYLSALTFQRTKNAANVTVNHEERKQGASNYSLEKLLRVFLHVIICFTYGFYPFSISKKPQYQIKDLAIGENNEDFNFGRQP